MVRPRPIASARGVPRSGFYRNCYWRHLEIVDLLAGMEAMHNWESKALDGTPREPNLAMFKNAGALLDVPQFKATLALAIFNCADAIDHADPKPTTTTSRPGASIVRGAQAVEEVGKF